MSKNYWKFIGGVLLGLGVLGAAVWYLFLDGDSNSTPRLESQEVQVDASPQEDESATHRAGSTKNSTEDRVAFNITKGLPKVETETAKLRSGVGFRGRVVDSDDIPLAGVRIRIELQNHGFASAKNVFANTDSNGQFEQWGLVPKSPYLIEAEHPEFLPETTLAKSPDRDLFELEAIRLSPGGAIEGIVYDSTQSPLKDAMVWVDSISDTEAGSPKQHLQSVRSRKWALTESDGRFRLSGIPPEVPIVLMALTLTHERSSVTITLVAKQTQDAIFRLNLGKPIGGVVTTSGNPISGAIVTAKILSYRGIAPTLELPPVTTDSTGRFYFPHTSDGAHSVVVAFEGHRNADRRNVSPGTIDLLIDMTPTGSIRGSVVGTSLRPGKLSMEIAKGLSMNSGTPTRTVQDIDGDNNSTFEIEGLIPGDYVLRVSSPHLAPSTSDPFVVIAGETTEGIIISGIQGAVLSGVVVSSESGKPIEGVTVRAVEAPERESRGGPVGVGPDHQSVAPVRSNSKGQFRFSGLRSKSWQLRLAHPDFATFLSPSLSLMAEETRNDLLYEMHSGGTLTGSVLDLQGNPRTFDSIVAISEDNFIFTRKGEVGSDGTYRIEHLTQGSYRVKRIRGKNTIEAQSRSKPENGNRMELAPVVLVANGNEYIVDFGDEALGFLSGLVTFQDQPVQSASVSLVRADSRSTNSSPSYSTNTDEKGIYKIDGIVPFLYEFQVRHPGSPVPQREPIEIVIGFQEHPAQLTGHTILGQIKSPTGDPVSGVRVSLQQNHEGDGQSLPFFAPSSVKVVTSDHNGDYEITFVPDGDYELEMLHEEFVLNEPIAIEFAEKIPSDQRVDAQLTHGAILQGRVLTAQGEHSAGALVLLIAPNGRRSQALTDKDGAYRITGISTDTYNISVNAFGLGKALRKSVSLISGGSYTIDFTLSDSRP